MEFIQNFVPTSKAQLIQVAMYYNKGDLQKAQEMFDFYNKNLSLPDFDPVAPTFMDQAKGFVKWIKDNQNDLLQGYDFFRSVIQNKGALPPLVSAQTEDPLPPINE